MRPLPRRRWAIGPCRCGESLRAPQPALFSYHSPLGACESCQGFGRTIGIDWDKVKTTIETARPNPAAAALRYVFEVDDPNAVTEQAGFVKVRYAGTGFLMIRRQALERMCARYPLLRYKRDHSLDAVDAKAGALDLGRSETGGD